MKEYELSDGDRAVGVSLPIPPHGSALVLGEDTTAVSQEILRQLESNWSELWPEMLRLLKEAMENLGIEIDLADQEVLASALQTREGEFMTDKSDIYLSLEIEGCPDWDYFIRGATIVHFQPVF